MNLHYSFNWRGFSFILFIFFLIQGELHAQETLNFHHLTPQQGLSQSTGHTIMQDSEGYMWFGTADGLNRYNGYEITVFKHNPIDSTTISGNNITFIYEDNRNTIWVGTTGAGLNQFHRDTQTFTHFRVDHDDIGDGISSNAINHILEDSNGNLWVATGNGLNLLNRETDTFTHFFADDENPESISHNSVLSLFEDRHNRLWIGTENGLTVWNRNQENTRVYRHNPSDPESISSNSIHIMIEDEQGIIWIGTERGLNRFDPETEIFERFLTDSGNPESISGNTVLSLLEDSRGVFWIGTENDGLNIFDREQQRFYHYKHDLDNPQSLSNNSVYALFENDNQILFVGTYAGGINYIDRKDPKFEHYAYDANIDFPLSSNSITSFLEDSRGNFWVGTDGGGLNRFDRETGHFYPMRHDPNNANSLSSDVVLALMEDWSGYLWIGYYNGGLSRYNVESGEFIHFRHNPEDPESLCQEHVFTLFQDWYGTIWAGTNGRGVCSYNPETNTFTRYQADEGVIRDILQDSYAIFWLATYGGGLKWLDLDTGDPWNFYEGHNGLRSNVVLSLHEDEAGNFWLGTAEGGLHLLDRDYLLIHDEFDPDHPIFTSYNMDHGLPSNIVHGILEDDHGVLWLSTNNGIARFNPETLDVDSYSIEDGLQGQEFNSLAYYKDRDGYMYFGGINGFNRFHPDSIRTNTFEYPVVLTDFKIFNRSVEIGGDSPLQKHISQTDRIELPHTATVLTFDYAALDFNHLKEARYAYMMEGFDTDWTNAEQRRTATYTNLNPGEYTFRVRTSNSDGVWNEQEVALALVIVPPFWQTTWFYFLSFLFITVLIAGIYRIRVRSIRTRNLVLEREVAERTDELKIKNRDLKQALKELESTKNELVEQAHKAGMADIATGVLHNVGNLLNSVNTSASLIENTVKQSHILKLEQANNLLKEQIDNFEEFITTDPKGKNLLRYYLMLEEPIKDEQKELLHQSNRLSEKINLINEVIAAQQTYAGGSMRADQTSLNEMIDFALTLQTGSIERHNLTVEKDLQATDSVLAQRSKLIHVLVNLIKNAKEAMAETANENKVIKIKSWQDENRVFLSISDNGTGIDPANLNKVFTQGFTTKTTGTGYGLHTAANYMAEMDGNIKVENNKTGTGATFTITLNKGQQEI